jgi:hypothetical protein
MRATRWLSASVISVLLGTAGAVYAQEQREEPKPAQEEARPESARPAQDDMKAPRQDEAKPQKQEEENNKDKAKQNEKVEKQDDRKATKQEQTQQRDQHAANQRGGRIPDDKFRANFGRQHTFVVNHPTVVSGRPQFQYGGYSFTIVDAWPAGWAYSDQCYIDYINGEYFLFDLLHPGVQIALVVVM